MTRRRRLSPVSRVCIGTLLLLLSAVAADTVKGPPTILEKAHSTEDETVIQKNRTILSKVEETDGLESSFESNDQTVEQNKRLEEAEDDVAGNVKTEVAAESNEKDAEVQGIRSQDDVERPVTSNSSNGGTKFEETAYGSSGKSSSTKAIAEDFYRSSRTNGLTTVTTKPGLEEPSTRLEEKRGRLTASTETKNNTKQEDEEKETGETSNGTDAKADSVDPSVLEGEKHDDKNARDVTPKGKLSILSNLGGKLEEVERERESTTPRETSRESGDRERQKKIGHEIESKNSEVSDLESVAEKNGGAGAISLINDTYVNYRPRDRATEGQTSENGTNFISEDSAVTHERLDPKEEVEVVENVTHAPSQRIVTGGQPPENRSSSIATKDRAFDENSDKAGDTVNNAANVTEGASSTNEAKQGDRKDFKLDDGKSDEGNEKKNEEDDSTSQNGTSPIPRGRTIGYSGVNEFPSHPTKSAGASSKEIDVSVSKKISVNKTIDQKPYPYVKSTKEPTTEADSRSNGQETTEETSAYENTIGRGESEKKIIVTEPSVVLENSIQQFKPTYYEKTTNGSSNGTTTVSGSSSSMTTASLTEARPTNESVVDEAHRGESKKTIESKPEAESKLADENDVPRGNEAEKVIAGKDESFDVTGNGITEVSLKQETLEGADKRASLESTFQQTDAVNGTTEAALVTNASERPHTDEKMPSNMDVQTDAEESLLIRSTLNVTEVSTEYSLTRENSTEKSAANTSPMSIPMENTTVVPTTTLSNVSEETSTVNISVDSGSLDANGTNEIPSGSVVETSNPEDLTATTTTSVEFEFVGLTEATVFPSANATEPSTSEERANTTEKAITTFLTTIQHSITENYTAEDAAVTINPEIVTDNSSMTDETETTSLDERSTTVPTRTTVPISSLTVESKEESTTSTILEGKTEKSSTRYEDAENVTKGASDSSSTTMDEELVTTINTEVPFVPLATANSTSISSATGATDVTRNTAGIPFTSSTMRPRIFVSSTWSTPADVPTEGTTDVIQTLSSDEITSLVRIVMEGSLHEVCSHLEMLRDTLAGILKSGMNKSVHPKQIMIHQNPCPSSASPTTTSTDVPLTSILVYVVDENGKFDSAMTNILPTLYNASSINFPVTETDPGNAIAVIVVSSVAFICLILLAGLLFIMRKRQTRFNYGERCRPVSLDAYSLDSVSAYNSVRRKGVARSSKRSYGNPTFEDSSAIPSHPLNFAALSSFCNDVNAISEEFTGIPQVSAKIDELPAGAEVKNRYANVIPLPETRVPLQKMNNDPLTEYINASYVRGPKNATRYYIACQGPMEATVTDFWRMIWEQQCKVIIMLTDLVENGVEKCTEYIPPSEVTDCHRLYGDFQVTLKKRETKEKYAISTLHLKNLENSTFREVYHIWYLWPSSGPQSDGAGLIAVLLESRALQRGGPGPVVVHCSPGTGRTGTLIALDLGIRQYEITRTVDVPRVVYIIRRDRAGAVQTKEQYAFIYKALNLYATKLAGGILEST